MPLDEVIKYCVMSVWSLAVVACVIYAFIRPKDDSRFIEKAVPWFRGFFFFSLFVLIAIKLLKKV